MDADRQPAVAGGVGAGVGGGIGAVVDQVLTVSVLANMAIAAAFGAVVAVGLFAVIRN